MKCISIALTSLMLSGSLLASDEQHDRAKPVVMKLHENLIAAVAQNAPDKVRSILDDMEEFAFSDVIANMEIIQKVCHQARQAKFYPLIELILQRKYVICPIETFFNHTLNYQDTECIDYLLNSKLRLGLTARELEDALYDACSKCNLSMIKVLMNGFERYGLKAELLGLMSFLDQLKPFTNEVRGKEAKLYLIRNADRQFGVNSFEFDIYLKALWDLALDSGEINLLEDLLSRNRNGENLSPDQNTMNTLYDYSIRKVNQQGFTAMVNNTPLMNVFLNRTENQARLSSYNLSEIMRRAGEYGLIDFIRSMVERDARYSRPSEEDLRGALDQAEIHGHQVVVDYLRPLILAEEVNLYHDQVNLANNYDVGGCLGVHNYASAPVRTEKEFEHKSIRLLDAVLTKVNEKCELLKDKDGKFPEGYLDFNAVSVELSNWIDTFVPESDRQIARNAAFFRLASDAEYELVLTLVVNYLKFYHQEGIELWIAAFIRESISAYNGESGVSCDRGIRERVVVGLRRIDAELDKLFVQVEGPALMANSIKKWNPVGNPAEVARHLLKGGLNASASAEEASTLFIQLLLSDVKANGLSMNDYEEAINAISDGILGNFEKISVELKRPE